MKFMSFEELTSRKSLGRRQKRAQWKLRIN